MNPNRESVASFLDELPHPAYRIVAALRDVIHRTVPDAEETVLWGGLSCHTPWIGGRVKGALCQITVQKADVRLEFIHGIRLKDPANLLCGGALSKRYTPIRTVAEARCPEIAALILDASAIGPLPDS